MDLLPLRAISFGGLEERQEPLDGTRALDLLVGITAVVTSDSSLSSSPFGGSYS